MYSCFLFVQVKALNEMSTIGKISKYWSGFVNNVFTNTANFGIQVPVDLDVRIKAVMIGACFLIVSMQNQEADLQTEADWDQRGLYYQLWSYKGISGVESQTYYLKEKLTGNLLIFMAAFGFYLLSIFRFLNFCLLNCLNSIPPVVQCLAWQDQIPTYMSNLPNSPKSLIHCVWMGVWTRTTVLLFLTVISNRECHFNSSVECYM